MNNERPMDILDAIINKKLYKSVYTKQADFLEYKTSPPTSSQFLTSMGTLYDKSLETPAASSSKSRYSEPRSSATEKLVSELPETPSRERSSTPTIAEGASPAVVGSPAGPIGSTPAAGGAAPAAPATPAVAAAPAAPAPAPEPAEDVAEARRASLWEGARFYTGPGQETFAVLTTHDAEQLLKELGVNLGDHKLAVDEHPVLLNLKNGSRALVFKGPDGSENVVIGSPNLLGAKIPDGNLELIHPYLYNIMTSKPSNGTNGSTNVLVQLQGDQSRSYDPTMLLLRLLIELLRESRNDGNRSNNSEANQLAKSILGNIQHVPKIEPSLRRVS
jgi:hypothetical protein